MAGLLYLAMILFMGLAAINTQANLLFGVFGLMIGMMVVSWVVGRADLRQLHVRRQMPPHLSVGVPTTIDYEFHNQKRHWPTVSVTLTELEGTGGFSRPPQAYLLHAAPGMSATAPAEVVPVRRGIYELNPYQLTTSFPFGFIRRATLAAQRDILLIFPAIAQVERRLLAMCRSADDVGESTRPRPGGMDEFYGLRQYRAGDNPRWIHWRRSAHTGVLVTREMTRVAPPRLIIAADTHLPGTPAAEQQALVERAIAMAASLASAALEDGLQVGACAWAGELVTIEPARGKQQREDVLTLFARLPANAEFDRDKLLLAAQAIARAAATVVLITPADLQSDPLAQGRGGTIVLSAAREDGRHWFQFPEGIRFE